MAMTGVPEIDRLLKEREDLITSMGYEANDPLIQELDRQIRASQLRIH